MFGRIAAGTFPVPFADLGHRRSRFDRLALVKRVSAMSLICRSLIIHAAEIFTDHPPLCRPAGD